MTQKELLYMVDAVNHEKSLAQIIEYYSTEISDKTLSNFLAKLAKKHETLEEKLKNVMESVKSE